MEAHDVSGSNSLGWIFWNKRDIGSLCTPLGSERAGGKVILAYQANRFMNGNRVSIAHMCDHGYRLPAISKVQCEDLGDLVSFRMNVLAGILIHEWR